jgi:hypothetical protein
VFSWCGAEVGAEITYLVPLFLLLSLILNHLIYFAVNDGQTPAPQYQGLRNAMATIFRQEGARGLYRGVTPNVWGSGSAWGFYFLLYVPSVTFIFCCMYHL